MKTATDLHWIIETLHKNTFCYEIISFVLDNKELKMTLQSAAATLVLTSDKERHNDE